MRSSPGCAGKPPQWLSSRAGAVVLLLWALPATPATQQQISQGGTVAPDAEIEIYNAAGSVRVTGWDRNEIQVSGTLGAGTERLEFENDGDQVEITVVIPRSRRRNPERQVGESHLEVMVPNRASLQIETLAASITVTDFGGSVGMESATGNVTFTGASAEVEVGSAAGNVEVTTTSNAAEIDVENMAGHVVVQLGGGDVSATTVTGSVRVIGGRVGEGDFESTSGSIYFEGEVAPGGELDFENFGGDIDLLIPENTAASFDIRTQAGTIETEFGYEGRRVEPFSAVREAEFTLGDGAEAAISIETFGGRVRVRKR